MGSSFGKTIKLTIFGESHGPAIGAVLEGLPPGLKVDADYMAAELDKRRAYGSISTARHEADIPEILSGVKNGLTEGTPLALIIRNTDVRSQDYQNSTVPRPSHADFTAQAKYMGFQDASGGGHFSGRLTAPIVAACAIIKQALEEKGILIGTHIARISSAEDRPFANDPAEDIKTLAGLQFPVLDSGAAAQMQQIIERCAAEGDSVGGVLETAVCGLDAGIGEPIFDTIEGEIAKAMFAVPAVKGVEFGAGFSFADRRGSQANDSFAVAGGKIVTTSNNSGGVNGGITNGMPVVFRTVVKPTPSIGKTQQSVDMQTLQPAELSIKGRHDPAIIHRARPVLDALTALVIADFYAQRYGYMWLRNDK